MEHTITFEGKFTPEAMDGWFNEPTPDPATDDFDGFVVGDIVSLIVGGPDMVVTAACEECGEVFTHWVDSNGDIISDTFPEETLRYA